MPVRTIAHEAEDATVGWKEYEKLLKDGMRLEECLENGKLSFGVARSLLDFADRAQAIDEGDCNMRNFLWASNMHYAIARNVKDEKLKNDLLCFGENKEEIRRKLWQKN